MTHTERFEGYAALVTGAARGIGAAARLREQGLTAQPVECDVADLPAVEAAVAHAVATSGRWSASAR